MLLLYLLRGTTSQLLRWLDRRPSHDCPETGSVSVQSLRHTPRSRRQQGQPDLCIRSHRSLSLRTDEFQGVLDTLRSGSVYHWYTLAAVYRLYSPEEIGTNLFNQTRTLSSELKANFSFQMSRRVSRTTNKINSGESRFA